VRAEVIKALAPDIAVICETHLEGQLKLTIDGYDSYMHNISLQHILATRPSGGVAILIGARLQQDYEVTEIDKSVDCLFILKLEEKISSHTILVVACYLPPANSPWGRNSTGFFANITNYLHLHDNCDNVFICCDLNARIGNRDAYIPDIDDVPPRTVLDKATNEHGDALCEFLIDCKMCIVNGCITLALDNWTYVSTKGKSVVDYMIIPSDTLSQCKKFQVLTSSSLINIHCNVPENDTWVQGMPLTTLFW
jgi:hypothetical protein